MARSKTGPDGFAAALIAWYQTHRRDLPWRRTRDPYRIWLSEVMLQQTRAAAAIPYYERFLERFPTIHDLAAAPEDDVLAAWAGLGYYSRARNLHRAARQVSERGAFPDSHGAIRELAGVGDYTAAAVASIAFGLPHAVLDGNVMRVLSRLDCEAGDIQSPKTRARMQARADQLLDPRRPGEFNQAIMELGATVCAPREPRCLLCPVRSFCQAVRQGVQNQYPVKLRDSREVHETKVLLVLERNGKILMWRRPPDSARMRGFWELPEADQVAEAVPGRLRGEFRHSITIHRYRFLVREAEAAVIPPGFEWVDVASLGSLPVSTIARKALKFQALADREVNN